VLGLVGLLVVASWNSAEAQMRAASAEVRRVVGKVEYQQKGQGAWTPAAVGTRLVAGDHIRAMAGGAADLDLPDGSTILVAENTRFVVSRLDYDTATRDRDASFHIVAGKIRAQVSQAAVSLVRARQSNFNVSTPNGVAAVRGTILVKAYNPATREALTFVFPSPGQAPGSARVTLADRTGKSVTILGGNFVRSVGGTMSAPMPISSLPPAVQAALQTAQNQSTLGANELIMISILVPTSDEIQGIVDTVLGSPVQAPVGSPVFAPVFPPAPTEPRDPTRNQPPTPPPPPSECGRESCQCGSPPCE
jgi:hypothetical protein